MKVLLIMPLSYGYYNSIIDVLLKRGDQVCFIPDFDENIIKRFIRKFFSISSLQNYYIRRKIGKLKDDFDVNTAKESASKLVSLFSEDEIKFYDFQVFVTSNGDKYPIIGYKNKNSEGLYWNYEGEI